MTFIIRPISYFDPYFCLKSMKLLIFYYLIKFFEWNLLMKSFIVIKPAKRFAKWSENVNFLAKLILRKRGSFWVWVGSEFFYHSLISTNFCNFTNIEGSVCKISHKNLKLSHVGGSCKDKRKVVTNLNYPIVPKPSKRIFCVI